MKAYTGKETNAGDIDPHLASLGGIQDILGCQVWEAAIEASLSTRTRQHIHQF